MACSRYLGPVQETRQKRFALLAGALLLLAGMSLAASACGTAGAAEVPLSRAYAVGETWIQEVTMAINADMENPHSTEMTDYRHLIDVVEKMRITNTVTDVTGGIITVEMEVEFLEMVSDGEAPDLSKWTELKPVQMTVRIDSTGKTLSVESAALDEYYGNMADLFGGDPGADFGSQYTDQPSILYPEDGQASVGEEWSYTYLVPLPGGAQELETTATAKLTGVSVEDGVQVATIDYTIDCPLDITMDLGPTYQEDMLLQDYEDLVVMMSVKGQYKFVGTAKVDTDTGRELFTDLAMEVEYETRITEAPEDFLPPDARGPIKTTMTVNMTMVQVE